MRTGFRGILTCMTIEKELQNIIGNYLGPYVSPNRLCNSNLWLGGTPSELLHFKERLGTCRKEFRGQVFVHGL